MNGQVDQDERINFLEKRRWVEHDLTYVIVEEFIRGDEKQLHLYRQKEDILGSEYLEEITTTTPMSPVYALLLRKIIKDGEFLSPTENGR